MLERAAGLRRTGRTRRFAGLIRDGAALFRGRRCDEPVDIPASIADRAVGDAVPGLEIQKRHHRRVKLNLLRPKAGVPADIAAKSSALHDDGTVLSLDIEPPVKLPR